MPSSFYAAANHLNSVNTIRPFVLPSFLSTLKLMQCRSAAALTIVHKEAFQADHKDFWVVFTGITSGVHQGQQVSIIVPFILYVEILITLAKLVNAPSAHLKIVCL
jgi:hypothetical protein